MSEPETQHAQHTVRWDEFVLLDEDDPRELVDGSLVEVEVPTEIHEHVVMLLGYFLLAWTRSGAGGRVLGSGYKVRISDRRGVMPDLQVHRDPRVSAGQQQGLAVGRPDLVVEVISPTSRRHDRVTKLQWYASIGVPEYWLVDPDARTVERLTLTGEHYLIAEVAAEDATFCPASFPGLAVPLAELWALPQ